MQKLSEAQTLILISDKQFKLNEMSIGRVRKFGIEFIQKVDIIQKEFGPDTMKEIAKMEVETVLIKYGDQLFVHITDILNGLFRYKNPEYKEITPDWVEENMTIRILKEIVYLIARQNSLPWLVPFFQDRFKIALETLKG